MTHLSSGHYIDQKKSPDNGHTREYHSTAARCDRTACDGVRVQFADYGGHKNRSSGWWRWRRTGSFTVSVIWRGKKWRV